MNDTDPVKVSVVVPVFNAESYVSECLSSIRNQTLHDIEIICVDDGSTDASPAILDLIARDDPRVRVIHQANSKRGPSCNSGLDASQGEYIVFFDADDACAPEMLERLSAIADEQNSDVVVSARAYYDETLRDLLYVTPFSSSVLSREMPFAASDIPNDVFTFSGNPAWNKLFRRSFLIDNQIRFQTIDSCTDILFTNLSLSLASRISIDGNAYYRYRTNATGGITSTAESRPGATDTVFEAFDAVRKSLEMRGLFSGFAKGFAKALFVTAGYRLARFTTERNVRTAYLRMRTEMISLLNEHQIDLSDILNEKQRGSLQLLLRWEDPFPYLQNEWRYSLESLNHTTYVSGQNRARLGEVRAQLQEQKALLKEARAQLQEQKALLSEHRIQLRKVQSDIRGKIAENENQRVYFENRLKDCVLAYENSYSWRITKPLRWIFSHIHKN